MQQKTSTNSQKQSQSNFQSAGTTSKGKTGYQAGRLIAPEDDWELTANPTVYLDDLPQPYKFINNCLDLLIMKPVFNQITLIEEKKKTPEYEGYLKEISATGFMDIEGITAMSQTAVTISSGGIIDKEGSSHIQNKILIGDKFGQIHLFDVSRKLILDKKQVFDGRKILHMSTATLAWLDTKLTYTAVIARGSPFIKIIAFKNNENKIQHLYNINMCPQFANPDNLEGNPDQSYLELPAEVRLSVDFVFMTVTNFNGEIKLLKMPSLINPLKEENEQPPAQQPVAGAKGGLQVPPQQNLAQIPSQSNLEDKTTIKYDIDSIQTQNLDLNQILISKIEAKKEQKFIDPYAYKPNEGQQEQIQSDSTEKKLAQFKYLLSERIKDQEGGDGGSLLKKSKLFPQIYFIRSQYCGKANENQSSRSLKQYFVTSGIVVIYLNSFDIQIYNIQKPSKENILSDYSIEYFNKIILSKKVNVKKKPEKSLASLVKTVRQKEEGSKNQQQEIYDLSKLKESMQKPSRSFKMPYQISASAYQSFDDNYQALAVGLIDGAIIIIDLILGIEKKFLEKHPGEISALAFWDDKVLISGSIDGRINLNDLEDESDKSKINRCQNCQDRRIPVAKVLSSDYGIGIAVDIEGNCRFYDLVRFKKIAKISSSNQRDLDSRFSFGSKCKWRLLPNVTMEVSAEAFLGVTQSHETTIPDSIKQDAETHKSTPKYFIQQDLLEDGKHSDHKSQIKSLRSIIDEVQELPFYLNKSSLCIFRFEEVIFNLFPNLAIMRRKGMTTKEMFLKTDPSKEQTNNQQQQPNLLMVDKKQDADASSLTNKSQFGKQPKTKSIVSSQSGRKSERLSVNFNLQQTSKEGSNQEYDIPTLKRLNPELYKEYSKQQRQMKDPIYQSLLHLKERYGYHEMRQQRIQKRTEEVTKELEAKNEEELMKTRKKNMKSTNKQ